jgi:hypothetical protein
MLRNSVMLGSVAGSLQCCINPIADAIPVPGGSEGDVEDVGDVKD